VQAHNIHIVLKVPETSPHWYQKGLLTAELREIFDSAPPAAHGSLTVSTKVKNVYLKAIGAAFAEEIVEEIQEQVAGPLARKISSIGDDCPVCYEEMSEEDDKAGRLVYDEALAGCGKALHTECFQQWQATMRAKGDAVTCVWCRAPWPTKESTLGSGEPASAARSSLGYVNMADAAGLSRQRDTSSYYHGPMRGRRTWKERYADD